VGGRIASAEWHSTGVVLTDNKQGFKASFYVTNFPDNLPLYRIRQAFEVCDILSDVYVARHRNASGQEFGFVRFVNVKNKIKLSQALNNVWFGDCRVWAREARFDRFAQNDSAIVALTVVGRNKEVVVRPVVTRYGKGIKNVRLRPKGEERRFEGDNMLRIGKVEVSVGRKPKVRRLVERVRGDLWGSREEGKGINGKILERKGTVSVKVKERLEGKEKSAADAKVIEPPCKNTFHFFTGL
jgi:hypothetical protein